MLSPNPAALRSAPDLVSGCQWATNDPAEVVRSCTALLNSDEPAEAWMYFNRGLAFQRLGRLDEAESNYSDAIKTDASFSAAYVNRGNVRVLRNRLPEALADYRKAVQLDPKDKVARQNLRRIERALRRLKALHSPADVKTGRKQ
jgi:Flp pilus assembly protein TadD